MSIELYQLVLFAGAFAVMVASPGPFVAAIAARSAAFGFRNGFMMALGASLAECVYVALAVFGLAALAASYGWTLEVLRWAGAAWLIWIGCGLLIDRTTLLDEAGGAVPSAGAARAFWSGVFINLGNPKAALFYMAIFPGFFDMNKIGIWDAAAILAVTLPIGLALDSSYAYAGAKARSLLRNEKSVKRVNRLTGGVMVGAGAAIAAS